MSGGAGRDAWCADRESRDLRPSPERRPEGADDARTRDDGDVEFAAGLFMGIALGLVVIGFIAVGSYDRGWDAALRRRAAPRSARAA